MIPLMQGIIVDRHHWMSEEEIVDCIAVSQGLPGVIALNMATYIGKQKKNVPGSIVATVGVILPSFLIIIAVVEVLRQIGDSRYIQGALVGIKAAATGLIAYSAFKVGRQVLHSVFAWILADAVGVALRKGAGVLFGEGICGRAAPAGHTAVIPAVRMIVSVRSIQSIRT